MTYWSNPSTLSAQKNIGLANKLYSQKKYCEAIPYFDKHLAEYIDKKALVKRGNCHFHCHALNEAVDDFENAIILGYVKSDVDFFMARTYQEQYKFELAIDYYKKYLASNLRDKRLRKKIVDEIKRCATGLNIQYLPPAHFIENMGNELNSKTDELNIIQSPNMENRYYFSVKNNENGRSTIYFASLEQGNWSGPYFLNEYHAQYNEQIIALSSNGMKLYFSRRNEADKTYKLLVDYYDSATGALTHYKAFEGPVYYERGDRDLFLINDSTFIFSSMREGGYGGYDLYLTGNRNGYWLVPKNLGNKINTRFDELSPFVTKSGSKLYFSSNNLQSMGGFDIFKSSYSQKEKDWLQAVNAGIPVNSANDELYFKISLEGTSGFLSSNRKMESFGGFDFFRIFFKDKLKEGEARTDELPFMVDYSFGKAVRDETIANASVSERAQREKDTHFEKKLIELVDNQLEQESSIHPFYYRKEKSVLDSEKNLLNIKNIANILQFYPEATVRFTAHCTPGDSMQGDILKTVEIVEDISNYLLNQGIRKRRIRILGAGSGFPAARAQVSERLIAASQKINNRIDVSFSKIPVNSGLTLEKPFVVQHLRDVKWPLYESLLQGLSYTIQIAESDSFQSGLFYDAFKDCFVEKHLIPGSYSYYSGIYKTYADAESALTIIKAKANDAIIAPYINGEPLKKKELLKAAKTYLDLINYLEKNRN